jgi:hypothetical protein
MAFSDAVFNCHRGNGGLTRLVHLSLCAFIVVCIAGSGYNLP